LGDEEAEAGVDRATASTVYRLGEAVVRFRRSVEVCYVGAGRFLDWGHSRPLPFNEVVYVCLGLTRESAALL
jgi:hypothetical protein